MEYEKEILVYNHNLLFKLMQKNIGVKHLRRWLCLRSLQCFNDKRIDMIDKSIHSRTEQYWGRTPSNIRTLARDYRKKYFVEDARLS